MEIILLKGERCLTKKEYEEFSKGDTIFGVDGNPQEIERWEDDTEKPKKELGKRRCKYVKQGSTYSITEYALEYLNEGTVDFDLAEEE